MLKTGVVMSRNWGGGGQRWQQEPQARQAWPGPATLARRLGPVVEARRAPLLLL